MVKTVHLRSLDCFWQLTGKISSAHVRDVDNSQNTSDNGPARRMSVVGNLIDRGSHQYLHCGEKKQEGQSNFVHVVHMQLPHCVLDHTYYSQIQEN